MNRHIADAKKTEISLSPLEKKRGEPGKYRMYCRAAVEKGILKVYLFAVTDIEENINFPMYRLFISRKERRFITYDEKLKKWRKALLESILWDVRINLGNIYVNDCDTKVIQKYLKTMQPAIRALEEFQANIRKEQRIRHDKKLTDSWDQVMKTISGLPKNWIGWVSKYGTVQCVWTTDYFSFRGKVWKILYKVVQSLSYPEETQDFWFCAPDLSCQNVV